MGPLRLWVDLRILPNQRLKEAVKEHHLSACTDELLADDGLLGVRIERPIEQKWMAGRFSALHNRVL